MNEMTRTLPAVALRELTILPSVVTHFDVSRPRSVKAVEAAMKREEELFLISQKDPEEENPTGDDLFDVGLIAHIKQIIKMPNNIIRVLVEGTERAGMIFLEEVDDYLEAEVCAYTENDFKRPTPLEEEALVRSVKELLDEYANGNQKLAKTIQMLIRKETTLDRIMDVAGNTLPLSFEKKQEILETIPLVDRFDVFSMILANEVNIMIIKNEVQKGIKAKIDKNQREYILREQLKFVREELGEDEASDAEQFEEKLAELIASDEVKEKIAKEISRFKSIGNNTSETSVVRSYIETLLEMPWDKMSEDNTDISRARQILEEDHYGMEKVKERVLEFLSVRNLTRKGEAPIICLAGPPGTGKTSIARSVARSLNKEYVRICLGGVRDEAEIRGHRRTYIGSMPGRIAAGIKSAGVKNPLMLLDEIDKVSADYKGDTAAALLEVLDGEQNSRFVDHYVEIPMDLSEVLFIATANDVSAISRPLLDRMEVIEVPGYTENEKLHIAKNHLVKKQMEANGLKKGQLRIADEALAEMIRSYTRESGVRSLERKIGAICRKTAREILENNRKFIRVTPKNLEQFLGKKKLRVNMANEKADIGIVRGLAWTQVGGDTLEIEVNVMPGKGEFALTGQLGDVMKESAKAGISYIRSVGRDYKIEDDFFKENDIHIHIPEGAVPKDGPSAGITMATAMMSAITKTPVRPDLAMTGEITLRGRVLPIGGLKEKLLAAKTAGITTVLIPEKNEEDILEMSEEITGGLTIIPVQNMQQVLEHAFV